MSFAGVGNYEKKRPETAEYLHIIDEYHTALPDSAGPSQKAESSLLISEFKQAEKAQGRYSVEDAGDKRLYYSRSQLIERIEIQNFRILRDIKINISLDTQDRGSWLLLLGENATGKSSILQAISLALIGSVGLKRLAHRIDPSSYLRKGCSKGHVRVFLTGQSEPVELELRKKAPFLRSRDRQQKVLLLGYGATRLMPRPGTRRIENPGASKVDNLFDPFCALSDGVPWLYSLKSEDFNRIARSLKKMLPNEDRIMLKKHSRPTRHLQARYDGSSVPLYDLSAGYRSVVSLVLDIISVIRFRWGAMESAEGIVLIDEIDAHLHPQWKMQIIDRLRNAFPRLQFIVTSHEPLTLRGLHTGEVAVLRRGRNGNISLITDLPSPRALRIDQILTSEFFGLNSTSDPVTERLFKEYYDLLAIRKPSSMERRQIAKLHEELADRELLGENRRERMMLEAADRFLATDDAEPNETLKNGRKQMVEKALEAMWMSSSGGTN